MTTIGITMGCPVGIGPEIICKYFHALPDEQQTTAVVIGDIDMLKRCQEELKIDVEPVVWQQGESRKTNQIPVIEVVSLNSGALQWGKPDGSTGKAAGDYVQQAVSLIQQGVLGGLVTCPLSKESLNQGGYQYPGHTEMLASLTESNQYAMMLAGKTLRVTLATIHCSLAEVPVRLSRESIYELIRITHKGLAVDFGINHPKIAVAGLNPHSGESGLFGNEEQTLIQPAIEDGLADNINVSGPFPPDTIFVQAAGGKYDAVVCMYHDQGLIPFKLLHFSDGVNITLGLPIVRTSVDHGTAYDIAGRGIAEPTSLANAVRLAGSIVINRSRYGTKQP